MGSGGLEIWVSSTSFQKRNIGWPQQPQTERISVKNGVIQVLEFIFTLMFWKTKFLVESWNIMLNFSTFSVGGCWGQSMLIFWKLVDETQISKPLESTRHNLIKLLILLPLRVDLLCNLQYEYVGTYVHNLSRSCLQLKMKIKIGLSESFYPNVQSIVEILILGRPNWSTWVSFWDFRFYSFKTCNHLYIN